MERQIAIFVAGIISAFAAVSLDAATITVTSNADSGAGTLRQAIADAADGDSFDFNLPSGQETITISSELEISKGLTIDGSNSDGSGVPVTVQVTTPGSSNFRVFSINASGKTIAINKMTMKGGDVSSLDAPRGGAIFIFAGTLNLANSANTTARRTVQERRLTLQAISGMDLGLKRQHAS